ncbi:hypothetical protein PAERUG_P40_Scotland_4_VIM_2_09_12_04101 [Pseudomonas aeruginosa]|nr:hypothetical protein [Pseudomonas aeruginosa]CRN66798.1 hypothetical protein PAERUG_P40_Scotland_4_VIM_2_09_12_04101 [Pseudomonas aeruginosa]
MNSLNFSLIISGTVRPCADDESANDSAVARSKLSVRLEQAVAEITGSSLLTGETFATLNDYSHCIRVTSGRFDMMSIPIISTAHLDQATAITLRENGGKCDWAVVACYPDGMFIRFLNEDGLDAKVPESARNIRQWLKSQGLTGWVRLDQDWDCVEGLPTYC